MFRFERLFGNDDESETNNRIVHTRINYQLHNNTVEYFRLNAMQIEHILERIGEHLVYSSAINNALSPLQQLLTTLHWLGNEGQYHGIAIMHGVDKSAVCRVVHKVVSTIVSCMLSSTICWHVNSQDVSSRFFELSGFSQVAGCVDGTIINIDAPIVNEDQYVNRHGKHSINAMMICGPDRSFYAVNANWPGSVHDARVLRNSKVFLNFENGFRPFPGAVILGDSAYPLKQWLLPPLHRNPNDAAEQGFNVAHKRTRRIIENSFGMLKEKFPCLNHLRVNPNFAGQVILACCILHNIAIQNSENDYFILDDGQNVAEDGRQEDNEFLNENHDLNIFQDFLNFFNE